VLGSVVYLADVQPGHTYTIQVSQVSDVAHPPVANLRISGYTGDCFEQLDDAFEENDSIEQAAPIGDGMHPDLFALNWEIDAYTFCVEPGGVVSVDVLFPHAAGDLNADLFESNSGTPVAFGRSLTDNEFLTYTNSGLLAQMLRLEVYVPYSNAVAICNRYDLMIAGSGSCTVDVGTPFCDPMDPNSTGLPTLLTGTMTAPFNDFHLELTQGPPGEFASFLVGNAAVEPGLPLGQGRLCLDVSAGNAIGRYRIAGTAMNSIGRFDSSGVLQNLVGTSTLGTGFDVPSELPAPIVPGFIFQGSTWHFQAWLRDGSNGSNFSNGLTVQF